MLSGWLEKIAYAVARGAVRGYLEALRQPQIHYQEEVTDEDEKLADNLGDAMLDALDGVHKEGHGDSGRESPPQDKPES
jgi:hypothetical protein